MATSRKVALEQAVDLSYDRILCCGGGGGGGDFYDRSSVSL